MDKQIDEILATFGGELYDYITEKDIIKAAEIYAEKPMHKKAKQRITALILEGRIDELENILTGNWTDPALQDVKDRLAELNKLLVEGAKNA